MGGCSSKSPIDFEEEEACFNHFKILRSIGKGAFGKVCIVKKRDTKTLFAMKYMNKEKCLSARAVKNVCNERKILEMLDHPLLVNLWYAFQDEEDMFMVVDLMLGGDISFHLQRSGAFSENRVRVYIAEITNALEYLHNVVGIVHRDIKPDNILLDEFGHAHLADFNVAAFLKSDNSKLTSRAGTRPYFAPEMISRQGYRQGCDWWSTGVTMLEMLTAKNPFRADKTDEIQHRICNMPIPWPDTFSPECLSVLKGLLERDPEKRLGGPDNKDSLLNHPWFSDIDWESVGKLGLSPEFVPDKDKVHCDAMHELEEMMLEDKPLSQKKSRLKKLQNLEEPAPGTHEYDMWKIKEQYKFYDREKMGRGKVTVTDVGRESILSEGNDNDSRSGPVDIEDSMKKQKNENASTSDTVEEMKRIEETKETAEKNEEVQNEASTQ